MKNEDSSPDKMDAATAVELAWGLIANAHGGDWDKATPEWKAAAERWRDEVMRVPLWEGEAEEDIEAEAANFSTAAKMVLGSGVTALIVVALFLWWLWPIATAFLG